MSEKVFATSCEVCVMRLADPLRKLFTENFMPVDTLVTPSFVVICSGEFSSRKVIAVF